ncbi:MAG TPA: ABC transporter permease [Bryobacteraceae bacterium]|nr:ABC transporter permease [Bryobacteraceae bacterium]
MSLWLDVRYALRFLRRTPLVSTIIILTLALCIGANTAIFSVVDATLLRPLPYPEPNRLVQIARHLRAPGFDGDDTSQDGKTWEMVRDHAGFLDAAVYGGSGGVNLVAAGHVQYVQQERVGSGFFRVLGVPPMIGREFTREEDRPGGQALTVLSHHLWKGVFNADPSVVGKPVMLRGEPYTIIAVMPENFRSSAPADLWVPLRPSTTGEGGGINYGVIGRLKPGVRWPEAEAQIEAIGARLVAQMTLPKDVSLRFHLQTFQQGQTEDLRKPLLIVWGAVALVLLIGCANITSLLLARSASRTREMATRLALGGARVAIIRQLLIESLVLAIAGGVAGLVVGYAGIVELRRLAQDQIPAVSAVRLDGRVLALTAMLALLTSVLAGIFPAFEASSVDIRASLTEGGARGIAGARKRWTRSMLVSGEIALAVLLLIGSGLLVRTLMHLYRLRPGFDPANVIAASFSLQDARYTTSESVNRLFNSGLARIRELPGVESAAVGLRLPYERHVNSGFRRLDGPEASDKDIITDLCYVTPDYFHTLRIPLLRGRAFRENDSSSSAPVVIVNQAFVRKYLSRQDALASHIKVEQGSAIVGVVGDVQQTPGWDPSAPLQPTPTVYIPAAQTSGEFLTLIHIWVSPSWIVRASGRRAGIIRGIQSVAATVDPLLPIAAFHNVEDVRAESLKSQRFEATLLGALAALALLLAVVGIYGLMAQSVAERRRELGIRIALGSTIPRAIRDATLPGVSLALAGVAVGCVLAGLSSKVLEHLIFGVSALDPLTYAGVALGLLAVAAVAGLIPALRVATLNPAETVREE